MIVPSLLFSLLPLNRWLRLSWLGFGTKHGIPSCYPRTMAWWSSPWRSLYEVDEIGNEQDLQCVCLVFIYLTLSEIVLDKIIRRFVWIKLTVSLMLELVFLILWPSSHTTKSIELSKYVPANFGSFSTYNRNASYPIIRNPACVFGLQEDHFVNCGSRLYRYKFRINNENVYTAHSNYILWYVAVQSKYLFLTRARTLQFILPISRLRLQDRESEFCPSEASGAWRLCGTNKLLASFSLSPLHGRGHIWIRARFVSNWCCHNMNRTWTWCPLVDAQFFSPVSRQSRVNTCCPWFRRPFFSSLLSARAVELLWIVLLALQLLIDLVYSAFSSMCPSTLAWSSDDLFLGFRLLVLPVCPHHRCRHHHLMNHCSWSLLVTLDV